VRTNEAHTPSIIVVSQSYAFALFFPKAKALLWRLSISEDLVCEIAVLLIALVERTLLRREFFIGYKVI